MSLLCRLKNLVHKGILKEKDLERIVIIPKGQEPCEDCISRAKLEKCFTVDMTDISIAECLALIIKRVKALPSIQPKPKTGHWIDHQGGSWIYAMCSECGNIHNTQTNYCPNCGAKMVEPQESEDKG